MVRPGIVVGRRGWAFVIRRAEVHRVRTITPHARTSGQVLVLILRATGHHLGVSCRHGVGRRSGQVARARLVSGSGAFGVVRVRAIAAFGGLTTA